MIELMKQLCALPGPSGCEDAVREFVLEKVKPFADEMKTDAIGNIMVFRKGKRRSSVRLCCVRTWMRSALSSRRLRTTAC